jgi:hypothetical protein
MVPAATAILATNRVVSPLESRTPGFACAPKERNSVDSRHKSEGATLLGLLGVLRISYLKAASFTFQRPCRLNKMFPYMGVLTKYDEIEPIYLPQSVVTYIYLHAVYIKPWP